MLRLYGYCIDRKLIKKISETVTIEFSERPFGNADITGEGKYKCLTTSFCTCSLSTE
ncbi:MAG: hypothetical protein JETT_2680 [Candidatus Jettenia ecosi]|uniref:Uncharacterized protein n=1 Tax=Candidatus Jettenia ecosi TaxID=2494326 RepID=A0A533QEF7_9BACT|nr:MAG: hypothetical protein JETT_2680 [Candidatus Jettenia ecosi]